VRKLFFGFIFFSLSVFLRAQPFDSFYSFSARSLGLGKSDVALADDWAAMVVNPAGLVQIKNIQFGASYSDFYQTDRLFQVNCGLARAFDFNAMGFFVNQLAVGSVYQEDTIKITWARQLDNNLAVGLNGVLYYQSLNRPDMVGLSSADSALSFDLGVIYQWSMWLTGGLMVENVSSAQIGLLRDFPPVVLPTVVRLGFDFQPLPATHLLLELDSPRIVSLGAEIAFSDLLFFRLGWNKDYPALGAGLKINWLRFDFGMLSNQELGNVYRLTFSGEL